MPSAASSSAVADSRALASSTSRAVMPGRYRSTMNFFIAVEARATQPRQQPGISPGLVPGGLSRGQLGARVDSELPVDLREVPLDGLRAQVERLGDLFVGAACDDELDDLALGR